jgi:hypothetical protein
LVRITSDVEKTQVERNKWRKIVDIPEHITDGAADDV